MKLKIVTKILSLVTFAFITQTSNAATVWSAQLESMTSLDYYTLHVVVSEDTLTPPSYSELTVTDIYLDHLGGDASAIDPATLLTTSSADLAVTDELDYYLINDLVNHPVGDMSGGVLSPGWISFSFFDANLRSVNDASNIGLACELGQEFCQFDVPINGAAIDNGDGSFTDVFVEQLRQDPFAPNPPTGPTSIINWNATAVSAVPVPAAVWLFSSGLIGLAGFAKRKRN